MSGGGNIRSRRGTCLRRSDGLLPICVVTAQQPVFPASKPRFLERRHGDPGCGGSAAVLRCEGRMVPAGTRLSKVVRKVTAAADAARYGVSAAAGRSVNHHVFDVCSR